MSVSFLFLVRPGAPSSFLFLVAMPGAPSSYVIIRPTFHSRVKLEPECYIYQDQICKQTCSPKTEATAKPGKLELISDFGSSLVLACFVLVILILRFNSGPTTSRLQRRLRTPSLSPKRPHQGGTNGSTLQNPAHPEHQV